MCFLLATTMFFSFPTVNALPVHFAYSLYLQLRLIMRKASCYWGLLCCLVLNENDDDESLRVQDLQPKEIYLVYEWYEVQGRSKVAPGSI